jgi:1-deoxy-D-xylulose-5-phosphate synthase
MMYLSRIHEPGDLKNLSFPELDKLAQEIRSLIIETVSRNGGHLASNLGVVEVAIALHRVFESPRDKIVWDVGHQCYAHKLLTGRLGAFPTLRKSGGMNGFPKRTESPHDAFDTGHASTSISAALGLLAGERLSGGDGRVVAVIGDGALTGGMAYEGLSHAGQLQLPLIVILNDNKMSIGPSVGGLSKYLSRLSMKSYYQAFRQTFDAIARKLPFVGESFFNLVVRLKRAVKAVFYSDNFFVDLGFEYVGPIRGHNIKQLVEVFEDVRSLNRPVVVHVITQKGKGYSFAENDPGVYHGVGAFSKEQGVKSAPEQKNLQPCESANFTGAFSASLVKAGRKDKRIVAITAAMGRGTGLLPFKKEFPERYFDVGIAEEHAVTFAAGLAARGLKPVVAIYSTFMQRAVDQVIHDICLQKLPVVFAMDRSGFISDDGETHQGLYDISLFRFAPGMTILCPASGAELETMLDFALTAKGPVMLRYPKAPCPKDREVFHEPLESGRGIFVGKTPGAGTCLFFTGSLYNQTCEAQKILASQGIDADLYNLRFLKPVDEDFLSDLMNRYKVAVFIEEGLRPGGFGEYAAELALRRKCETRILVLSAQAEADFLGKRDELIARAGLDGPGLASAVAQAVSRLKN